MSVQEKPRKDKEDAAIEESKKVSVEDWIDTFESTKQKKEKILSTALEAETEEKEDLETLQSTIEDLVQKFVEELPPWTNKPWMYVKPKHEGHLTSWFSSWQALIISYTSTLQRHIISILELQQIHPFSNKNLNKNLSRKDFELIIDNMVRENLAKWLDTTKNLARIYYQSDEELSLIIYEYLMEQGYGTEVLTIYEFKQFHTHWAQLPEDELIIIFEILVQKDKAQWVGVGKDSLEILI